MLDAPGVFTQSDLPFGEVNLMVGFLFPTRMKSNPALGLGSPGFQGGLKGLLEL